MTDYEARLKQIADLADSLMTDYVETNGYTVCNDIREVVEKAMLENDTQPSHELFERSIERIREIYSQYGEITEEDDEEDGEISDIITALRHCSECICKDCPRFMDEDGDGENKYTTLCSEALMRNAADMLEMMANV